MILEKGLHPGQVMPSMALASILIIVVHKT